VLSKIFMGKLKTKNHAILSKDGHWEWHDQCPAKTTGSQRFSWLQINKISEIVSRWSMIFPVNVELSVVWERSLFVDCLTCRQRERRSHHQSFFFFSLNVTTQLNFYFIIVVCCNFSLLYYCYPIFFIFT